MEFRRVLFRSGGTAVTLDSGNDVKNAGTIQISDASNAAGIRATATGSGAITNSGKIVLDEDYTPTDDDDDGDLDGPFAKGRSEERRGGKAGASTVRSRW